ncbi:MAG: hypothetical protein ABIC04_03765 [Nanoarchaeota archaeon]
MIEFIVLLILIITFAFLLYPIITIPTFLINVSLMIIIAIRVKADIKENQMQIYYAFSAFLTAVILVAKEYGFLKIVSDFLFDNLILYYTQALIILLICAHLVALSHNTFNNLKKQYAAKKV